MDAPVKGRRGRKKSADKVHIGRTDPLPLVDVIRVTDANEKHRLYYIDGDVPNSISSSTDIPEEAFVIVFASFKERSACKDYLTVLSENVNPKRVICVPKTECKDIDAFREVIEGLGMAFLEDQMMIFKEGNRYVYESADVLKANATEIREEMMGSDFSIIGSSSISDGGLYRHLLKQVSTANLVIASGTFSGTFNINWTYVSNSIKVSPTGMRVFNDIDGKPRYFDIPGRQNQSMSFKEGMSVMNAEDYRIFLEGMGMPSTYKTDKDVTIITQDGISMVFLTIRIFTSTILDGGTLLKIEHPRDYFMENLATFSHNVRTQFMPYYQRLKEVAAAVRRIGGAGDISGCTILVDENLKMIVDPTDLSTVLYRAATGNLIYYDSFADSAFIDDSVIMSDDRLKSALTLKKVSGNVPAHLQRKSIRDMNHMSDAFQALISQDMVRRWDDRLLDPSATLADVMKKLKFDGEVE